MLHPDLSEVLYITEGTCVAPQPHAIIVVRRNPMTRAADQSCNPTPSTPLPQL